LSLVRVSRIVRGKRGRRSKSLVFRDLTGFPQGIAAVDGWDNLKIVRLGRRSSRPFQAAGVPGVFRYNLAIAHTPQQIKHEDEQAQSEDERTYRTEEVNRVPAQAGR